MLKSFFAALIAVGAVAVPAAATTYISYTGTVGYRGGSYSTDYAGLFLDTPGDLGGLSFSALLTIDGSVAGTTTTLGDFDSSFTSGAAAGLPTAVSASLTINGRTVSLSGSYLGLIVQVDRFAGTPCSGCGDELYDRVIQQNPDSTHSELNFDTATVAGNMVSTPAFYAPLDYDVVEPAGKIAAFNFAQNGATAAEGYLDVAHITISDAAPVPEPGEWAMIVMGLGLVGRAARRKVAGSHRG